MKIRQDTSNMHRYILNVHIETCMRDISQNVIIKKNNLSIMAFNIYPRCSNNF